MKRLPDSTLSTAEACAAFGTVIDAELAEKRKRLAERRQAEQDRARHAVAVEPLTLQVIQRRLGVDTITALRIQAALAVHVPEVPNAR